ncbi:MAG: PHP domain-containing protein, partial [Planctomycetota bacterium]
MMRNLPKTRTLSALVCLSLLPLGVFACGDGGGSGSSGGASSTTTSGGTTGQTGGVSTPTTPPAGAWLKGDLHVHTSHSGDTDRFGDDVETSIKIAEYAGLDYVVLGDHRQTTILSDPQLRGTATSLVVIPGMEWGGGGHAGAHGIFRDPPYMTQTGATAADKLQSIQDTIADVHNQGGFFSLNHPVDPRNPFGYPVQGMDGIEIWNGLWALRAVADLDRAALDDWTVRRGFPASGLNAPPEMLDAVSHLGGGKNHQA